MQINFYPAAVKCQLMVWCWALIVSETESVRAETCRARSLRTALSHHFWRHAASAETCCWVLRRKCSSLGRGSSKGPRVGIRDAMKMKLKLTSPIAAMLIMIAAPHYANGNTGANRVQRLNAKIAEAEHAAAEDKKATDRICYSAGSKMSQSPLGSTNRSGAQLKDCINAAQTMNDAIGLVGYLYEERSRLTGQPVPSGYLCNGKPSLGVPHPDANGHFTVCPKDPGDHSYKFWIITQVRMQASSAKETWSDGGLISLRRYSSESACRMGMAKFEDYPSKIPYKLRDGVIVGDVCVKVVIPDLRELLQRAH